MNMINIYYSMVSKANPKHSALLNSESGDGLDERYTVELRFRGSTWPLLRSYSSVLMSTRSGDMEFQL